LLLLLLQKLLLVVLKLQNFFESFLFLDLLLFLQDGLDGQVVLSQELVEVHVLQFKVVIELVPDFRAHECALTHIQ
jgi:hypothetical protein